ncbi:MAG: metal-dependent hydrolase [Myxococcales bacterium]|nr:metal-dependent hydrolase [Myxococcales bacterium]
MANYRTHISWGAIVGVSAAATAKMAYPSVGWQVLPLGAFLGFVGGMIPDVDHDTGHALDTIAAMLSTFLPVLTLTVYGEARESWTIWSLAVLFPCHYLLHWGLKQLAPWDYSKKGVTRTYTREAFRAVVVASICAVPALFFFKKLPLPLPHTLALMIVIAILVQVSLPLFRLVTTHRGSIHSVPVAVVYGELVYLFMYRFTVQDRVALAICALLGALSHLLLDEIYSVNFDGKITVKRSFGTAFSFWKQDYASQMIGIYVAMFLLLAFCLFV